MSYRSFRYCETVLYAATAFLNIDQNLDSSLYICNKFQRCDVCNSKFNGYPLKCLLYEKYK